MCVGIPVLITATNGLMAKCKGRNGVEEIDLALTGEQAVGTWLLSFLGAARQVLSEEEARNINKALDALEAVNEGRAIGDAFADLEERGPQLPPHLMEAFLSGKTTA